MLDAHLGVRHTKRAWKVSSHWHLARIPSLFLELLSFKVDGEFKITYSQAFNMILKEAFISLLSVQCAILLEAPRRHFDIGKVQIFRSGRELLSEDSSLAEPGREQSAGQTTAYILWTPDHFSTPFSSSLSHRGSESPIPFDF